MSLPIDWFECVYDVLTANPDHSVSTTLSGAVDDSVSSFALADGSAFPERRPIVILIDSELFLATRSGNTLTLMGVRGAFGTTAASHSDGAAVHQAVLYDAVTTRVWNDQAQYGYENENPALVIQAFLEPVGATGLMEGNLSISCFPGSASFRESRAIRRLLWDRFHDYSGDVSNGGIMCAREVRSQTVPPQDEERGKSWPRTIATYEVTLG